MGLSLELRKQIQESFDLDEIKTMCSDIGIRYDELPGDRLSRKVSSLLVAAYRIPKLDVLHQFLTEERPREDWPSLAEINAFDWQGDISKLEFPPAIANQFTVGSVGAGAVVVQGGQANVQTGGNRTDGGVTGDQVAGNKLIQNIYNTYHQSANVSSLGPLIRAIKQQLNYIQILYFAGTGAISFLALSMILDPWVSNFGENSFRVVALLTFLFVAIGLIPGAAYGYFLTYIGEKIYKEKYNLQFLGLNAAVFGLSFMIVAISNDAAARRDFNGLYGLLVGVIFGICMTVPWWIRSVNDRIYRVLLTVALCVAFPFGADILFGYPIATIVGSPTEQPSVQMQNALVVWMVFGGALSFYYSIWPQDITNILEIADSEG